MKRLITLLWGLGALLVVVFVIWLIMSLVAGQKATMEPYEVTKVKTQAQIAEVERQAASADFFNHLWQLTALVIIGLLLAAGVVALMIVWNNYKHARRMEELRLKKSWDILEADPVLGNYPAYLDRSTGQITRVKPGNGPHAKPASNFIVGNSPVSLVKERTNNSRSEVPILVNNYQGQRFTTGTGSTTGPQDTTVYNVREVKPAELSQPDPARKAPETFSQSNRSETGENVEVSDVSGVSESFVSSDFQDFSEIIATAKRKGRRKVEALTEITGLKPGGSKAYKVYADYWETLPGPAEY